MKSAIRSGLSLGLMFLIVVDVNAQALIASVSKWEPWVIEAEGPCSCINNHKFYLDTDCIC